MSKPVVAIVGRPNVGKSTLFNRMVGGQRAIVHEQEGVTRDRIYGEVDWSGLLFTLIDTGGYLPEKVDIMEESVRRQVEFAMDEARVLLFVVDGREGVTPVDESIAGMLRKSGKNCITAVNKIDSGKQEVLGHEFSSLGLDPMVTISATGGRKIGDLLDMVVELAGASPEYSEEEGKTGVRVAIVGMPNVGKSSIANALLGHEKYIVTELPGTTRDSTDSELTLEGETYVLVDTAGLRKKARVKEDLEFYSALRSHKAIDGSDVVLVIIDGMKGFGRQDQQIVREVIDKGKGLVLVVNKWDLVEKETNTHVEYRKSISRLFKSLENYPVLFVSALTKQRISKIIPECKAVYDRQYVNISTSSLNRIVKDAVKGHHPPAVKGKNIRVKYVTQTGTAPPTFSFFCTFPQLIPASYKNYLENQLRLKVDLVGTPVRLVFKRS